MEPISIPTFLSDSHRQRLQWFQLNAGTTVGWPIQLADGALLANRAKGIFKPADSQYALSVKQTVASPYADRDPTFNADGSWSYLYYQEEQQDKDPELLSSNRAMRLCMRDGVPVGVLRQLSPKPNVRYNVLGLAKIIGKAAGYYLLDGMPAPRAVAKVVDGGIEYKPSPVATKIVRDFEMDLRIFRLRSVVQRQGQAMLGNS